MSYSVSVVIPNYNGKHLLEENLPSVISLLQNIDYEVIISDDGSKDDSVKFIREKYPQVKLIVSDINQGFSKAVNAGIKAAAQQLVLILNSDVKLKADYFQSQWKYFEKADTFGVMGSIWTEDGKRLMDAAKYPQWKGGQLRTTINYKGKEKNSHPRYTLFLSGANALVDRKKLMQLGGMDERYSPYYMEDVDLSVRAWRMGWKCYYEPEAICYHKLSETISNNSTSKHVKLISKRNKFIFHDTHLEGTKRTLWNAGNIINLLFRWLILDMDYYKAYNAYKQIPKRPAKLSKSLEKVVEDILTPLKSTEIELF